MLAVCTVALASSVRWRT